MKHLFALLSGALIISFASNSCEEMQENYQEVEVVNGQKVNTMPFEAAVSRGNNTTRVTVDDDFKTLRFESGDKLYISSTERSDVKGVLNITSGVGETSGASFEGTLEYVGETPSDSLPLVATLVSTKNRGVVISSEGKVSGFSYPSTISPGDIFTSGSALKDVIEAYSYLTGENYLVNHSFTLSQQNSFFKFHITIQTETAGGVPSKPSSVSLEILNDGDKKVDITNLSTTQENNFSVVDFVIPFDKSIQLDEACVRIGGHSAGFGGTRQLEGKVYYVNRAVVNYGDAVVGDIFYSDGTFSTNLMEGKTPIGIIAYLASDSRSENGVELRDGSHLSSSGLVLSAKHGVTDALWAPASIPLVKNYEPNAYVCDSLGLLRTDSLSGYNATRFLAQSDNAQTNYPACYYAWNFNTLPSPPNTTGWFLPSAPQWAGILAKTNGLGSLKILPPYAANLDIFDCISFGPTLDKDTACINKIDRALEKIPGYDPFGAGIDRRIWRFWTSSEYFNGISSPSAVAIYAIGYTYDPDDSSTEPNGIRIGGYLKWMTGATVLPVLAF